MATQFRIVAFALAFGVICLSSFEARAEGSAAPVQAALAAWNRGWATARMAKRWSAYLNLPSLHAELAKGDKADPAVIAARAEEARQRRRGLGTRPVRETSRALWRNGPKNSRSPARPACPRRPCRRRPQFRPISDADLAADKAALEAAVAKLDRYLKSGGANGAAWREYLRWNDLEAQLKADKPDVDVLKSVSQRFAADQVGLELPVFADVAAAARALRQRPVGQQGRSQNAVRHAAQDFVRRAQSNTRPDRTTNWRSAWADGWAGWTACGKRLRWCGAIRKRYSQPNLHVRASHRLVGAGIARPVDEVTPVNDVILGTNITGTGRTVGKVDLKLVPTTDKATLETVLIGQSPFAHRRTQRAGHDPQQRHHGNRRPQAHRDRRARPGQLSGHGDGQDEDHDHGHRGRAFGFGHGAADRHEEGLRSQAARRNRSARSTRPRVCKRRVEQEAAVGLGKAHWNYVNKVRNPLLRRREFPALFQFSTTDDSLFVIAQQANRFQIGAPDNPPSVTVENDLAVQVHESMINNLAAALLGGVTLKEEEVQKQAIELLGELPEQLKSENDRDPWSITFAKIRPVTIQFADNGFQFTVRGQRYTSGDRDFQAMNVTADYKIESRRRRFPTRAQGRVADRAAELCQRQVAVGSANRAQDAARKAVWQDAR